MASLRRLPDSRNWIACFTDRAGRRRQRSIGTPKRKDAQGIANALEETARRMKTEAQVRRVMSDLFRTISGGPLPAGSVRDFFNGWIARKRTENADRTAERYAAVVNAFLDHLGEKTFVDLAYLSGADLVSFRDTLLKRIGPSTVNQNIKILSIALNQAKREGLIEQNPAASVMAVKRRDQELERRPFSLPELRRILDVANAEWRGMIAFGIYTGQRLSDIARLTWNNVDMVHEEIRLRTAKTARRTVLPIAKPLLHYLTELPVSDDPSQPLFPKAFRIMTSSQHSGTLSNQFHRVLADAGLVGGERSHRAQGKGRDASALSMAFSFSSRSWFREEAMRAGISNPLDAGPSAVLEGTRSVTWYLSAVCAHTPRFCRACRSNDTLPEQPH